MVHLVHNSRSLHTAAISPRIKQIIFGKVEEIPDLLASHLVAARSVLRADAPMFVPRTGYASQSAPVGDQPEDAREEQPEPGSNVVEALAEEQQPVDEVPLSPVVDKLIRPEGPSEVEISAARVFQVAYRKHVNIRHRSTRAGINAERHAIFEKCLKYIKSSDWEPGLYRLLCLGPLPHLLLALDKGINIARAAKAKTKVLWTTVGHERIEDLGRQLSDITYASFPFLKSCWFTRMFFEGLSSRKAETCARKWTSMRHSTRTGISNP